MIEFRQLSELSQFEEVLRLQQTIWGFADVELLPLRFLVVVRKVGGHLFGAFDGEQMVGFCFAIPGIKPGGVAYLHSHMLGVLPCYHNAGIGRRLKLMQRDEALSRGISLIEWTFDPMELKNAFLNIEKLGAIVRRYTENAYGVTASPLHGGLPTDRCTAEWWLDSPRVRAVLAGEAVAQGPGERKPMHGGNVSGGSTPVEPGNERPDESGRSRQECLRHGERVAYPAGIARIRAEDPARAREIQKANGQKLREAFARGLAVTGFERGETEGTYLLEPWP